MQKQVFPIIGDEKDLPFYIVGIGADALEQEYRLYYEKRKL